MTAFVMNLFAASHEQRISGVTSFIGEDASGYFGIQPHHVRFMTTLVFGLARFKIADGDWQYLALPGAVAYFNHDELTISTRSFLIDTDIERISLQLEQELMTEEENLRATKQSLHQMEQAIFKRMLALNRKGGWTI